MLRGGLGAVRDQRRGEGQAGLKDGGDCGGFSAAEAAAWLKLPSGKVKRSVAQSGPRLWLCSYLAGGSTPAIAFSIEIAKDGKTAAVEMERYRDNLMVAAETAPFKGKLPKGAYSDIMGVGDEGVWTDINGAYTVRKGHVTVQFTLPKEKLSQVQLAKIVLAKF
ncbi:MAG: hypothetical protein M5U08_04935 [Burkholderiales bacterium]|nr:hypothetical protein [Burkholderiales bacterium]